MATQIIEFAFDAGETVSIVATPVADLETEYTANVVNEIRGGLFQASFVDQAMTVGLYRFEAVADDVVLGRGMVNITAAAGTFRETAESMATVDATEVANAINETGVSIAEFQADALDQLRAADVDLGQWDPTTEPADIYRGIDHLEATDNAFHFTNTAGTWPDLTDCTVRMELNINGVTAVAGAGTVVVASGANQHFYIEVLRTAFDASLIKDGTGIFRVVRIDGSGNRFPLANGIGTLHANTAPAE